MTLAQLMSWNRKIPLEEYEYLLKKLEYKQRALGRTQETVYSEEISLDILKEEKGSDRWQRHEKRYLTALKRIEKLKMEIAKIEATIQGE